MSGYPTCHAVVVGDQPHEDCDVCTLLAALDEITAVDGEGRPLHDQVAMYQLADDALADALNQPGASNAKHLDGQPADTEDRHNVARDSRKGRGT